MNGDLPPPEAEPTRHPPIQWRKFMFRCAALACQYAVKLLPRPEPRSHVCVIRLDAIGDFVMWLGAARGLRALYPGKAIVLYANVAWADLARALPHWDEVVAIHPVRLANDLPYRLRTLSAFRKSAPGVVINPTRSRLLWDGDSLVHVSAAPVRIGAHGDDANIRRWQRRLTNRWYSRLVCQGSPLNSELLYNLQFMADLGAPPASLGAPSIVPTGGRSSWLGDTGQYAVLFPGASWNGKCWPPARFASVADGIEELGVRTVLCGSPSDKDYARSVSSACRRSPIDLTGVTSLADLVEVLRHACLLVSNDTSAVHIAAAVGTQSVCILGGGHFGRFLPYPEASPYAPLVASVSMPCYGCNWRCIYSRAPGAAVRCIEEVTVGMVLELVRQALSASPKRSGPLVDAT